MGRVESSIQTDVIKYLRGRGCYVYNVPGSASSAKGTSDLLVCYKGLFVAIELKRPDGDYGETVSQRIRRKQVTKADGTAEVVTSIADVATLLHSLRGVTQ